MVEPSPREMATWWMASRPNPMPSPMNSSAPRRSTPSATEILVPWFPQCTHWK
jgi:hypothetical protein